MWKTGVSVKKTILFVRHDLCITSGIAVNKK